jgi:hypothetical protein
VAVSLAQEIVSCVCTDAQLWRGFRTSVWNFVLAGPTVRECAHQRRFLAPNASPWMSSHAQLQREALGLAEAGEM